MNKPLTIDELKALKVDDWVWVVCNNRGIYLRKCLYDENEFVTCRLSDCFKYFDYDKTWLAYKNKEMAECKGEIVELPCIRTIERKAGKLYEVVYVQIGGMIGNETYPNKSDAERRLAELRGKLMN